jgi:hypothetical protein
MVFVNIFQRCWANFPFFHLQPTHGGRPARVAASCMAAARSTGVQAWAWARPRPPPPAKGATLTRLPGGAELEAQRARARGRRGARLASSRRRNLADRRRGRGGTGGGDARAPGGGARGEGSTGEVVGIRVRMWERFRLAAQILKKWNWLKKTSEDSRSSGLFRQVWAFFLLKEPSKRLGLTKSEEASPTHKGCGPHRRVIKAGERCVGGGRRPQRRRRRRQPSLPDRDRSRYYARQWLRRRTEGGACHPSRRRGGFWYWTSPRLRASRR